MSNSRSRTTTPPTQAAGGQGRGSASPVVRSDRWIVAAFVALVILGGVLFLTLRGGGDAASEASGEFEHVHGLGVDPGDGALYAGTHYGLFRVPERGEAVRVADRVQDFMGFTVVGPGHFLASGHPGADQDGPSSLGLIESTDGGQTWKARSLSGEADFHALQMRHGRVYGYNSMTGGFMVSDDLRTWQTRSQLPMADFAVSPDDPDVVLATTEQGLARSTDGGRSFLPLGQAPRLLLLAWSEDGTIIGIDPRGQVYASGDDAASWQHRGDLEAAPEALEAVSGTEIYAAAGGAVLSSTDGGRSFQVRYGR